MLAVLVLLSFLFFFEWVCLKKIAKKRQKIDNEIETSFFFSYISAVNLSEVVEEEKETVAREKKKIGAPAIVT